MINDGKMIKVSDVKDAQVQEQINIRKELLNSLGGQLYRGIVTDEIIALNKRIDT